MKNFICSVDIDKPIQEVVELWQDEDQLEHWQEGLLGLEHLSGEKGAVGATMRLRYRMKGSAKEFDLVETILVNDLPNRFKGRYEGGGMVNTMDNNFTTIPNNGTRWEADIEYLEFKGIVLNIMARIAPGMFKKQTQKWLNRFKELAETS